jgi:hypothetical protein
MRGLRESCFLRLRALRASVVRPDGLRERSRASVRSDFLILRLSLTAIIGLVSYFFLRWLWGNPWNP